MPSRANLEALYNGWYGMAIRPPMEPMLTMYPLPWRRMMGSTARHTRNAPKRFTSNCRFASSIDVSSSGPAMAMPALFTTMSRRPSR